MNQPASVKHVRLNEGAQRTFALIFEKGDEIVRETTAFARREGVTAAHFTAIGALTDAVLGYFDPARKDYRRIPVAEQVEVLTLVGDIAVENGDPKVHAHAVLGRSDGTTRGGHLLEAHVWPTLELVLTESPAELRRRSDPETGLALIDPAASRPAG
jgi:predicted DNA-binding protein with PD1-like motif